MGKVLPNQSENLRGIVMEVMHSIHKLHYFNLSACSCVLEPLDVFLFLFLKQMFSYFLPQEDENNMPKAELS